MIEDRNGNVIRLMPLCVSPAFSCVLVIRFHVYLFIWKYYNLKSKEDNFYIEGCQWHRTQTSCSSPGRHIYLQIDVEGLW